MANGVTPVVVVVVVSSSSPDSRHEDVTEEGSSKSLLCCEQKESAGFQWLSLHVQDDERKDSDWMEDGRECSLEQREHFIMEIVEGVEEVGYGSSASSRVIRSAEASSGYGWKSEGKSRFGLWAKAAESRVERVWEAGVGEVRRGVVRGGVVRGGEVGRGFLLKRGADSSTRPKCRAISTLERYFFFEGE